MPAPKPKFIMPDEPPQRTYSENAEATFIPTGSQSLLESIHGQWPEDDGPEQLIFLATRQPGLYATLLGKLIAGSSFKAASMAIGVPVTKIYYWMQQGSTDLTNDLDTYCSRLLLDCQRARAVGVSDAEERVHKSNPDKWLTKSEAKEFHKGKYWQEQNQLPPGQDPNTIGGPAEIDPLDPPPVKQIEHVEEEDDGDIELEEAYKVLDTHGIITNPEFVNQARDQFKMRKPEEKDEYLPSDSK